MQESMNRALSHITLQTLDRLGVSDAEQLAGMTLYEFLEKYHGRHIGEAVTDELVEAGYLEVGKEEHIDGIPMSTRLRNVLKRNDILYLELLSRYPRETILGFRSMGEVSMRECERICRDRGIAIRSLQEVRESFLPVEYSREQAETLFKAGIYSREILAEIPEDRLCMLAAEKPSFYRKLEASREDMD